MKAAIAPFLLLLNTLVTVSTQTKDSVILMKDSTTVRLPDVYTTSERPLVTVTNDILSLDMLSLVMAKSVNTAFDILRGIPGLVREGDNVNITGVPTTSIITNGRRGSVLLSQTIELLKPVLTSKIKSIELLYSSPPRYGVKGSSIDIIMEEKVSEDLSADIPLTGKQAFYFSSAGLVSLSYSREKYNLDLSYSINYNHFRSTEDMNAHPIVKDRPYEILQESTAIGRSMDHTIGVSTNWFMDKGCEVDISYYVKITDPNSKRYSNALSVDIENVESDNRLSGLKNPQNVQLNYAYSKNLSARVDYTYYKDHRDQYMISDYPDTRREVEATPWQNICLANVPVSYERAPERGWKINVGTNAQLSFTDNSFFTHQDKQEDLSATLAQKEGEYTTGLYAGFFKRFNKELVLNAFLSAEYNKMVINLTGWKWIPWSGVNLYPQSNLSYTIDPSNILQANFSNDKKYLARWVISSNVSHLNVYSQVRGNPYLEPECTCMVRANYILRKKYVFGLSTNHHVNYTHQLYYQDAKALRACYQSVSFNKHNTFGAMIVILFQIGRMVNPRFMVSGLSVQDEGVSIDISFDWKKLFRQLMLLSTFALPKKKNLSSEVNTRYSTPSVQGAYDVDGDYNVSTGPAWNPIPKELNVMLQGEDLLKGLRAKTHTDHPDQKSDMTIYSDTCSVLLILKYTSGKVNRKNKKEIDSPRLGQ